MKRPAIPESINEENRISHGSDETISTREVNRILQFGGTTEAPRETDYSKDHESKSSNFGTRLLLVRQDSSNSTKSSYSEAENPLQDYLLALVNRHYIQQ